ncbi:hypothetical protein [Pseudactinotalea suaedae]|uniref:hypothetical protein n=1 Tax=Pseudactinotalea suaedae TaxID=1524924 RepID=UPI001F502A7C|nr:hypothetical protein [Pseudactinotalea suaedae]
MSATSDIRTASQPAPASTRTPSHEHAWVTESRHRTSEGDVLYVRCGGCRAQRIDLQRRSDAPPTALTRSISAVGNNP